MKLGLIGHSHMGIVSAAGWASLGYEVVSVDNDKIVAKNLQSGILPISEPGLEELFTKHRQKIVFSDDFSLLSACPVVFLTKDTPTKEDNEADTDVLISLIEAAEPHLSRETIFVSMSQIPVGFARKMLGTLSRDHSGLDSRFYTLVETLVIGDAVKRFLEPERFIVGAADSKIDLAQPLLSLLAGFKCPILKMSYESAELTKAAINLYLANSVTFANTLADLCEIAGANIQEIIPALQMDKRIGQHAYLRPGLGIGGGNLERDLAMLADVARKSKPAPLIEAILAYNKNRMQWLENKIQAHVFSRIDKPTVALWGLAYKKNTASLKNAPSLGAIKFLNDKASIRAYDPLIKELPAGYEKVTICPDKYEALNGADGLLVLTDWDEFKEVDWQRVINVMRSTVIVDCVKILPWQLAKKDNSDIMYHSPGN